MRVFLALLFVAAAPIAAQQPSNSLPFLMPATSQSVPDESRGYFELQVDAPLRIGEVRSAGYLTEGRNIAFGKVLGPTRPPQVSSTKSPATFTRGASIAIEPPVGVTYQPGDTVVFAVRRPAPDGWGEIVVPTGLARVLGREGRQTLTTLLRTFGPVRRDQDVYPLEAYTSRDGEKLVAVSGSASGSVIGKRDRRELISAGGYLFVDLGPAQGTRLGDFVEIRRTPSERLNASDTIDERMALGQVVHVGERSSTVRILKVITPDIPAGSRVIRVATLPG